MTPYEEYNQRLMAQMIAKATNTPPPGMVNQSAASPEDLAAMSTDIAGQERGIASQRALAAAMRGHQAPQGRTVGPSNIYVGPNWGESLEHLTNQLAGGYVAGQANKADEALDETRTRLNKAKLKLERHDKDRDYGIDLGGLQVRQSQAEETSRANRAGEGFQNARIGLEQTRVGQADAELDLDFAQHEFDKQREAARVQEVFNEIERETASAELDHERAVELERIKKGLTDRGFVNEYSDATNTAINGLKSVREREAAIMMLNTTTKLDKLTTTATNGLEEGLNWASPKADLAAELAGNITGTDAARNIVKSKTYNEKEKTIRGMAADSVEAYRRARTGANLTGVEIRIGEDWDPTAPSIGAEESLRRIIELNRVVKVWLNSMGVPLSAQKDAAGGSEGETLPGLTPEETRRFKELKARNERT